MMRSLAHPTTPSISLSNLQHIKRSFKPTDTWYENEHRELMQLDSSKESPILAFRKGRAYANGSSTEV